MSEIKLCSISYGVIQCSVQNQILYLSVYLLESKYEFFLKERVKNFESKEKLKIEKN